MYTTFLLVFLRRPFKLTELFCNCWKSYDTLTPKGGLPRPGLERRGEWRKLRDGHGVCSGEAGMLWDQMEVVAAQHCGRATNATELCA